LLRMICLHSEKGQKYAKNIDNLWMRLEQGYCTFRG
jgi:hypothetical protein